MGHAKREMRARSENNFMVMLLQGSLKSHMFDYDKKLKIRQEKVQARLKQAFCFSSQWMQDRIPDVCSLILGGTEWNFCSLKWVHPVCKDTADATSLQPSLIVLLSKF